MGDVVEKARKLMERLPPRPWTLWRGRPEVFSLVKEQDRCSITSAKGGGQIVDFSDLMSDHGKAMAMRLARYFAASPKVIDDLCAEVEQLRTRIGELEQQAETACEAPADDCDCAGCLTARDRNAEAAQ